MAVDTRNKRASVIGLAFSVLLTLPAPDATVHDVDRPHLAYSYSGLTAEAPVVGPPDIVNATVTFRRNVAGTATFARTVQTTMHVRGTVETEIER